MKPQLPVQPNPNPNNNKAVQVIDIQNLPTSPMQCNDIHLRFGRVFEPIIDDITSSDSDKEEAEQSKSSNKDVDTVNPPSNKIAETVKPPSNGIAETTKPSFPERLALTKTPKPPAFNLLGELQNLYVKIPLLQALRDVPIYARTVRDICIKKPGRKAKDPLTVHVMGDLAALMTGKVPPIKYGDLGHPTVTVLVRKTIVSRVLVDLGAAINIMTLETTQLLQLKNTKAKLGGHPLILGRPWLATTDAFISCRSGSMTISNGCETKQLTLYPHATPMINNDDSVWLDYEDNDTQPILTIGQALTLKDTTEDEVISNFISEPSSVTSEAHNQLTAILDPETQQKLKYEDFPQTSTSISSKSITGEIEPFKTLNINPNLSDAETQQLMKLLRESKEAFAWDYTNMKGISPELCTHRIYIKEGARPVCQPQ
eukprot:PITA_07077